MRRGDVLRCDVRRSDAIPCVMGCDDVQQKQQTSRDQERHETTRSEMSTSHTDTEIGRAKNNSC
jgi:hypothetical protein